jgi:hypothetical protein
MQPGEAKLTRERIRELWPRTNEGQLDTAESRLTANAYDFAKVNEVLDSLFEMMEFFEFARVRAEYERKHGRIEVYGNNTPEAQQARRDAERQREAELAAYWKAAKLVVGSLSDDEFSEQLQAVKDQIDPRVFDFLMSHKPRQSNVLCGAIYARLTGKVAC